MNDIERKIARDLTVFGNAVTGVHSMFHSGSRLEEPSKPLPPKLYEDPVPIAGVLSAEAAQSNEQMLRALTNELGAWLAISVREAVKGTDLEGKPEYRFLKHVRDGIAHGNRFTFENYPDGIPRSVWRGNEITTEFEGCRVVSTTDSSSPFMQNAEWIEGYLEAGDIKELCRDMLVMARNVG